MLMAMLRSRIGAVEELSGAGFEASSTDLSDLDAERLEGAAQLVLDIQEFAFQQPSVRQQDAQLHAVVALHMHPAEPAHAHHLGDSARIVLVGLVALSP